MNKVLVLVLSALGGSLVTILLSVVTQTPLVVNVAIISVAVLLLTLAFLLHIRQSPSKEKPAKTEKT